MPRLHGHGDWSGRERSHLCGSGGRGGLEGSCYLLEGHVWSLEYLRGCREGPHVQIPDFFICAPIYFYTQPYAVRRRAGYARTFSVSPLWHTGHGSDFDELLLDRPLY